MSLTRVTITGADDDVPPAALQALSAEFPFVEWGILFSWKRHGTPRYPSQTWMNNLGDLCSEGDDWGGMRLAAHFCGEIARTVLGGNNGPLEVLSGEYRRVQLNGWNAESRFLPGAVTKAYSEEFILQVCDLARLSHAADHAVRAPAGRISALFDGSGGRGIRPASWPRAPVGLPLGYAGGISPDNVLEVLIELQANVADYWIDMESGVRTNDRFDLDKVRSVLRTAAPFVKRVS